MMDRKKNSGSSQQDVFSVHVIEWMTLKRVGGRDGLRSGDKMELALLRNLIRVNG